jgi:uncharacterized phage protein (TIGR02218 family)
MRTPSWESSAGALAALLNGGLTVPGHLLMADLHTVTLPGGTVLRWSGADRLFTVAGNTWTLGPVIQRSRTRIVRGVQVDTLDVTLSAGAGGATPVSIAGTPLLAYIARGGFNNARWRVERLFAAAWTAPVGLLPQFSGRVAEVDGTRAEVKLTVVSDLELLDVQLPRNLYQPACLNTLYDAACGVNRAALAIAGTVAGASNGARTTVGHALGQAVGYFDLGVITFTSGPNAGVSRTVKSHTATHLEFVTPLPFAAAIGNTFSIVPGCNKTQSTCQTKFSNLPRFRGQPYIPVPETAT